MLLKENQSWKCNIVSAECDYTSYTYNTSILWALPPSGKQMNEFMFKDAELQALRFHISFLFNVLFGVLIYKKVYVWF